MTNLRKHSKGILICTLGALFYCYEYLLRIIPGVMEAPLRVAFGHISATAFGTLTAYYYFAYTPMQLPAGMLMDRVGAHKLLSFACGICVIGSFLFIQNHSLALAASGRFLVGFGSAFAFVGVLKLANSWLPKRYLSVVAGSVTTLGMLGAIAGQEGMSYLVLKHGYQFVLTVSAAAGVLLALLLVTCLRDKPSDEVMVPGRLFLRQVAAVLCSLQIWVIGLVGALLFMSLSVFAEVWGKSYLIQAHQLSDLQAASCVSLVFLGWAIGAPIVGFISEKTNKPLDILLWCSVAATVMISFVLFNAHLSLVSLSVLLFAYGLFCSAEVLVFVLARDNSAEHLVGTGLAVVNMIVMIGGAVFQPLVGKLLDVFWDGQMEGAIRIYSQQDYQLVLSFLPLATVVAGILVFFIKHEKA